MHAGASSSITTVEGEWQYWDPLAGQGRKAPASTWRHHYECARAVLRAPLPAGEKLELLLGVLRYAVADREDLLLELRETVLSRAGR
jgi:hypothetical protein